MTLTIFDSSTYSNLASLEAGHLWLTLMAVWLFPEMECDPVDLYFRCPSNFVRRLVKVPHLVPLTIRNLAVLGLLTFLSIPAQASRDSTGFDRILPNLCLTASVLMETSKEVEVPDDRALAVMPVGYLAPQMPDDNFSNGEFQFSRAHQHKFRL